MTRYPATALVLALAACADSGPGAVDAPDTYAFEGRTGEGSVSYSGQTFRHLLINDMKGRIGGFTARLNGDGGDAWFPEAGDVTDELDFYWRFDSATSGSLDHGTTTDPSTKQTTYDDVSSDKNLVDKIAGNDAVGQHRDWNTDGIIGWAGNPSPQALVETWIATLDDQAVDWANGTYPLDPDRAPVAAVYLTAEGLDLQQLLQKFLLGAVAFSQGADDYLDDDEPGKGLLADHSALDEDNPYTALEHQWDEGFGYFGASRDFALRTDEAIADAAASDTVVEDGAIDLKSEMCWGASVNAAKRDNGANVATDFTAQAWAGFAGGRALIDSWTEAPTEAQLDELRAYRDDALAGWEGAIAATAVHYINDTLQDLDKIGTDAYSFADHAKHFGELKGFALSLQFNPHRPISDADLATLHDLIGDAPTLDADDVEDRKDDLVDARAILGTAYGFDDDNLGDDDGLNGW